MYPELNFNDWSVTKFYDMKHKAVYHELLPCPVAMATEKVLSPAQVTRWCPWHLVTCVCLHADTTDREISGIPGIPGALPEFGWAREDLGQSPRNGRELYLPSLSCLCEEDMFTLVSLYLCLSLSMCLLCIIVTSIGLYLSVLYLSPSISLYLSVFYLSPCIYIAIYQLYLSSLSYLCEEDICKCMSISLSFFSLSISIHIFIHLSLHLFTCRLYYLPCLYICEKGIWLS